MNILVAFALVLIAPKFFREVSEHIAKKFWVDMGIGGAVIILTVLACLFLLITVIGIPLALITMALYCIAVFCGKLFVAQTLSTWAIKTFKLEKINPYLALFLSLAVIIFFTKLIGFAVLGLGMFITLATAALGVGGIFLVIVEKIKANR